MKLINKKILFNIIGFYLCWFISFYGASINNFYLGPVSVIVFLFVHFSKVMYDRKEIIFILICLFSGFVVDSIFLNLGIIKYKGISPMSSNLAPIWVVSLWACFGATIYHSFRWAKRKYLTMFFLGAVSGPFIYFSAYNMRVLFFDDNFIEVLVVISIIWSIVIPLLILISDKIIKEK